VIYETAREVAVKVLNRIERTDSYLDKLLDFELRNSDLSKLDTSFLTELVNGTIRWKMRIDYVISQFYRGDYAKLDINIKNAIRIAMYQIMFLERVPQSAAVNEAVEFVKKLRGQFLANLVNAILRTSIRKLETIEYPSIDEDPVKALSTIHSFPAWLVRRFVERFGVYETEQLLSSLNERPKLSVRVNAKRIAPEELATSFEAKGLKVTRGQFIGNFFYVEGLSRIGELESFRAGQFTVQDESAGIVSKLLDPKPGDRILDMCAAPGGKTTHILELTDGAVDLTAIEKYENRARLIQDAVDRMGYSNVKIVVADAAKYSEAVMFDKILIDAPCTGFGVMRKKPDSKWKREAEDISLLKGIQSEILDNAARLVKPDGTIVYSTCTIEPEENQEVVQGFLDRHSEFELQPAENFVDRSLVGKDGFVETFPHRHDMDGSFAARLRKVR
jgi:16S rRNA (cytosine967-C5)-methyltransferase